MRSYSRKVRVSRGVLGGWTSGSFVIRPRRIRTSDLLIGNQIPIARPHKIKSFHNPATTLLPVRTLRIPVLRRTINNRSGIKTRRVIYGRWGFPGPVQGSPTSFRALRTMGLSGSVG